MTNPQINPKPKPRRFRKFVKFVLFLMLLGGWVIAYAALYVVRAPGKTPWISDYAPTFGTYHVFTKDQLDFRQTFSDTTEWTLADVMEHRELVRRLQTLNQSRLFSHVATPALIADAIRGILPPPPKPTTKPGSLSIEDLNSINAALEKQPPPATQPSVDDRPTPPPSPPKKPTTNEPSIFDFGRERRR